MRPSFFDVSRFGALFGALTILGCAHGPESHATQPMRAFECSGDALSRSRAFGRALTLAHEVDYLQVISHGGGHDDFTVGERGTRCANATNLPACEAELDRVEQAWLKAHNPCAECRGATLVLTTERDSVAHYDEPSELLALLGPIDSPADAWLVLMTRDGLPRYTCGDASTSGYRVLPARIELSRQEWTSTCRPIERVEIIEAVDRSGSTRVVSRKVVERETKGCFVP